MSLFGEKYTLINIEIVGVRNSRVHPREETEERKLTFTREGYGVEGHYRKGDAHFGGTDIVLHLYKREDWEKYQLHDQYILNLVQA